MSTAVADLLPAADRVLVSLRLVLLASGAVRVELPDYRGRWHRYALAGHGRGVELRREDTGAVYVAWPDGRCDCPAWRFGGGKACKHVGAARVIRALRTIEQ